ncbi:hypothetical protein JCM5353_008546 [Sporobolomyces roseus]
MASLLLQRTTHLLSHPPSSCTCASFRSFSSLPPRLGSFNRPAPPSLPPQQQREFEELIRRQSAPASKPIDGTTHLSQPEEGELELHPDYRARPKAKFEGDRNPETGEVGGPKNEPLQHGDWSYGGKCTDF